MDANMKGKLAMLMGAVIAAVDLYWTYTSYHYLPWLASGVIILLADLVWLYIDWGFMK